MANASIDLEQVDLQKTETQFGNALQIYISATNEDIIRGEEGEVPTHIMVAERYADLIAFEKPDVKKKTYASISSESKQLLAEILREFLIEIKDVDMKDILKATIRKPTPQQESDKLEGVSPDDHVKVVKDLTDCVQAKYILNIVLEVIEDPENSITQFIVDLGTSKNIKHDSTLGEASAGNYFTAKIENLLPEHKKQSDELVRLLSKMFDKFLKSVSWILARHLWKDYGSVNKKLFSAILFSRGINQNLLSQLEDSLREKGEKPKKIVIKETEPKPKRAPRKKTAEDEVAAKPKTTRAKKTSEDAKVDAKPKATRAKKTSEDVKVDAKPKVTKKATDSETKPKKTSETKAVKKTDAAKPAKKVVKKKVNSDSDESEPEDVLNMSDSELESLVDEE